MLRSPTVGVNHSGLAGSAAHQGGIDRFRSIRLEPEDWHRRHRHQCASEAHRLAHVLVDMGVAPGDMIVIYMSTDIKGLVAQLAATLVGATYHFVFGAKGPDIFSDTVHNMGAKVIITEDGYRVVINVNRGAGQVVFHLHLHVMGGRQFA